MSIEIIHREFSKPPYNNPMDADQADCTAASHLYVVFAVPRALNC